MSIVLRLGALLMLACAAAAVSCSAGSANKGKITGANGGSSNSGGTGSSASGGAAAMAGFVMLSHSCGDGVVDASEQCDDHNAVLGDGCSPSCQIEAGCTCPDKMHCTCGVCGDGILGGAEQCDDGNMTSADGCSNCMLDPGWVCHAPGKKCVPLCGDGMVVPPEQCDDNNVANGDGCSANCLVEPGASCSGAPSVCTVAVCGNGVKEGNEGCDCGDGTAAHPPGAGCPGPNGLFIGDGTGCSKTCTKEPACRGTQTAPPYSGTNHACNTSCGNGNIETGEDCDDGNNTANDGCSPTCTIEAGFTCTPTMKSDLATCTQAINAGKQCLELPVLYRDFKDEHSAGGHPDFFWHGATVTPAVAVTSNGVTSFNKRYCVPNTAGDGPRLANGGDTTARSWDIAQSTLDANGKPQFNASRAGGNLVACQFSDWSAGNNGNGGAVPGYVAANSPLNASGVTGSVSNGGPQYVGTAPIVKDATSFSQWWRNGTYESDGTTPNKYLVGTLELAAIAGGLYQYASPSHSVWGGFYPFDDALKNGYQMYQAATAVAAPGAAPGTLTMTPAAWSETFLCDVWPYWYSTGFGDGNGCKAKQYILPPTASATTCNGAGFTNWWSGCWLGGGDGDVNKAVVEQAWRHDSWFTTEARYLFNFNGAFSLDFYGDDDTFVFINGTMVIDLGGVHQRIPGHVDVAANGTATYAWGGAIDPATGKITACPGRYPFQAPAGTQMLTSPADCKTGSIPLALATGKTYEIAVFGADRGAPESNFQLTFSGFSTQESSCGPRCGDGVASGAEECDCGDGTGALPAGCTAPNGPDYGGCGTDCKWGPFCGDGTPQNPPEECDTGVKTNTGTYGMMGACTPGCTYAHYCGDAVVDAANGEQCDAGMANGNGADMLCDSTCHYKPK